jgi:DNA mismatch repair protein MutS
MSKVESYTKEIFVKDYFDIHNHYVKIYGKSTLILMQVGSFHEAYNTDNEGPDLYYLGERINMTVTQKNKSKPLSISNPRMMGFPSYIVEDMVERIVNLGYTIIRIDQTSEPPNPKREVVGIFSPSTLINSTNKSIHNSSNNYSNNYLVCIIIDALKLKTPNPILCIGITSYDISSGTGCCYETVSTTYDTMLALDNTVRFLEKYPPTETIYHFSIGLVNYINMQSNNNTINRMSMDDIIKYLGITNDMTTYKLSNPEMVLNIKYQTSFIENIFNNNLDNINLHAYNYARISLVGLLEFTKNHQPILLKKLNEPTYYDNNDTLYLGNHALDQLDVIITTSNNNNNKTLFDIINKNKTPMGKRFLIDQLCNPLINEDKLNERYNIIDILMNKLDDNYLFEKISSELNNIYDLPKIIRKMELAKIYPLEIVHLFNSIEQINKVFKTMRSVNNKIIKKNLGIDKDICDKLKEVNKHIINTFDMDYIVSLSFANYKEEKHNFIINNKYENLNILMSDIDICNNFMDNLVSVLEKFIEEQNNKVIKKDCNSITLKHNDRDGHYMVLTKRRSKILLEKLNKMTSFKVGNMDINVSDLEFKDLPALNNTKIVCKKITEYSNNVDKLKLKLANEIKIAFYNEIDIIIKDYRDTIINASNIIKLLDFLNSGADGAYNLGYCKPIINMHINNNISYFDAKQLRHPIIEVINTDTIYHPHDISLGKPDSVLLFGVNSSGKSSLMKSIGLAIIMAQIGYYVPAKEFTFSPYSNIFTRIRGNDDLYKGLSSFMLEMVELGAILKRNNNKTLVLADELAKGTEYKSSLIIISYMLETLQKSNTSFISASHLHSLCDLPCIKNLKNVKTMHIKVSFDEIKNELIYDRELSEGEGEHFYGLLVCKYFMKSDNFNTRTKEIEYEVESQHIKKSNYNNNVFMISCQICGAKKNLESHHIEPQRNCDKIKSIENPHIKKNENYNLVILCSKCHDSHDRGDINIIGWKETSNGRKLEIN